MRQLDPNGSIREYRQERDRRYQRNTFFLCLGIAALLIALYAGYLCYLDFTSVGK